MDLHRFLIFAALLFCSAAALPVQEPHLEEQRLDPKVIDALRTLKEANIQFSWWSDAVNKARNVVVKPFEKAAEGVGYAIDRVRGDSNPEKGWDGSTYAPPPPPPSNSIHFTIPTTTTDDVTEPSTKLAEAVTDASTQTSEPTSVTQPTIETTKQQDVTEPQTETESSTAAARSEPADDDRQKDDKSDPTEGTTAADNPSSVPPEQTSGDTEELKNQIADISSKLEQFKSEVTSGVESMQVGFNSTVQILDIKRTELKNRLTQRIEGETEAMQQLIKTEANRTDTLNQTLNELKADYKEFVKSVYEFDKPQINRTLAAIADIQNQLGDTHRRLNKDDELLTEQTGRLDAKIDKLAEELKKQNESQSEDTKRLINEAVGKLHDEKSEATGALKYRVGQIEEKQKASDQTQQDVFTLKSQVGRLQLDLAKRQTDTEVAFQIENKLSLWSRSEQEDVDRKIRTSSEQLAASMKQISDQVDAKIDSKSETAMRLIRSQTEQLIDERLKNLQQQPIHVEKEIKDIKTEELLNLATAERQIEMLTDTVHRLEEQVDRLNDEIRKPDNRSHPILPTDPIPTDQSQTALTTNATEPTQTADDPDKALVASFGDFVKKPEFTSISKNQFKSLLTRDDLNVESEQVVYDAVLEWVRFDPEARSKHLCDLMSQVRLMTLPDAGKFLALHALSDSLIKQDECATQLVNDARGVMKGFDPEMVVPATSSKVQRRRS